MKTIDEYCILKWSAGAYQNVITSVEIGALGRAAHL